MEIPQNTINMGLTAPVSCRSVFRIQRANVSRLVAGPGMGSVLVIGGMTARPQAPQHCFLSSGLGSPGVWVQLCPLREAC